MNVIIDLKNSSNAKSFEKGNRIHSHEFEKVWDWVSKKAENSPAPKSSTHCKEEQEKINKEQLHDTITILGSRGSGKTSFLLNLLKECRSIYCDDIAVLDIIDPTLIEEKGHIFLTIIAQIKAMVEEHLNKCDYKPESQAALSRKEWESKLKSLAGGLPSMDGVGKGLTEDNWQDPEYIMHKGLKNVQSAKKLEENFRELVRLGLSILDKKIFLIPLDDIDINFEKGWPVLETIRKYLTSPYLITILSGDVRLFSYAIRKQQWSNFGKALLKNEGELLEKMSDYNDMVTEMESQYLQKVLKPQYRIHLTTLAEKINVYGKNLEIYVEDKNNKIEEYYNNILQKFGIYHSYEAEAYRSFLLSLPLRTQIQFLSEMQPMLENEDTVFDLMNVSDAFLSDLYEKEVQIGQARSMPKYLNAIILQLLLNEKVLDEAYQLQPITTDTSLNSSLISLSFLFAQKSIHEPYLVFDYFIRIGYVRNLYSILGYQDDNKSNGAISLLTPSIEGLCKFSALFQDEVYRNMACYMTAYIRAFLSQDKESLDCWGGTIPLYGLAEYAKGAKAKLKNRIDRVFARNKILEEQIAFMPVSISQPTSKQQTLVTYSIYVLLASIGELLRQYKETKNIRAVLTELSQTHFYPMPNFENLQIAEEVEDEKGLQDVEEDENDNESDMEINLTHVARLIQRWIRKYPTESTLSPSLLGKISTRLFYGIRNLEDVETVDNLGDAMHNRMIVFLNSVLVVETREKLSSNMSKNNPNGKDYILIENIKKLNEEDRYSLSFTEWIFNSPILIAYLKNDLSEDSQKLFDALKYFQADKTFFSIYPELSEVKIRKGKIVPNKPQKRVNFYYGKDTYVQNLDILKKFMSYRRFNSISFKEFKKDADVYFSGVTETAYTSFRKLLKNNNTSW